MGELGNLFNLVFTFPMFNALVLLFRLFGDFGLAIIVLTVIIKLILFPLTLRQLRSMKATQALQPQIAELKKKYAKDQQAQLMATQALYKEYGVNPVAGCLPLIPQLFVLYGLFNAFNFVLRYAPKKGDPSLLQHINASIYPFLPHFTTLPNLNLNWFTFLNHAWYIPLGQPDPTHVLPILAGLATFVQLRMSQPATATAASKDDPTAQSMKLMQYMMPLFTVFIGWTFPAGLALYWTVSSIFQAVQQYFVTGWGNLLVRPNLTSKAAVPTNKRDFSQEKQGMGTINFFGRSIPVDTSKSTKRVVEGSVEPAAKNDGPIERELRVVPAMNASGTGTNGSSSAARRRASGGSASARRRSNGSGSSSSQKRNSSRR